MFFLKSSRFYKVISVCVAFSVFGNGLLFSNTVFSSEKFNKNQQTNKTFLESKETICREETENFQEKNIFQKFLNVEKTKSLISDFLKLILIPFFLPSLIVVPFTYLIVYFPQNIDGSKTKEKSNALPQEEIIKGEKKDENEATTVDNFVEKIESLEADTKPLKKEKITKVVAGSSENEKKYEKITIKNKKETMPIKKESTLPLKKESTLPLKKESTLPYYHKQESLSKKNTAKKDEDDYIYFFITVLFFLVFVSVCYTTNSGKIYTKSFLDKDKICIIDNKTVEVFFIGEEKVKIDNVKLKNLILPNLENVFKINEEENIITLFNNEKIDISNQKNLYKVNQEKKIELESNEDLKNSEIKDSSFLKSEEFRKLLLNIKEGKNFKKRKTNLSVNEVLPVLTFSGNNCSVLSAFYLTHVEEYRVLYSLLSCMSAKDVLDAFKVVMKDMVKKKKFLKKEYEKFNNLDEEEQVNLIDFYLKNKLKLLYKFPDLSKEVKEPKKLKDFEEWENLNLGKLTHTSTQEKFGFGSARKKVRYFIDPVDTLMTFGFYPGLTSGEISLDYEVGEYKNIKIGEFFTNSKYIVFSWGKVTDGLLVGEKEEEPYSFVLKDSSNLSDIEEHNAESNTVHLKISGKDFICGALPDTGYSSLKFDKIELGDITKYLDSKYVCGEQLNVDEIYKEFKKYTKNYFESVAKEELIRLVKNNRATIKATLKSVCEERYKMIKEGLERMVKECVGFFGNCSIGWLEDKDFGNILNRLLENLPAIINSIDENVYRLDEDFFEKVKSDLLTTAKEFISKQSVENTEDTEEIAKIAKRFIDEIFNTLEEKILEKCEPEWDKELSVDDQHNKRKNFVKSEAEKKLEDLLNNYEEKKIKQDIRENGYLPISIMKKAIRKKIEEKTKINYNGEQYEKMWENGSLIFHGKYGWSFFVNSVSKKVKKDENKLKFNYGYNKEKMYIAAIPLHSGVAGKDGGGHWTCLQPKYKWDKNKKEYVISKWVLLNCDGRAHTIFSNKEARDFLKEKLSQRSGDSNLQCCKQSVARIITKEEIEAAPNYYIMDDYGNMGKKENIRPDAISEKKSPIPDIWLKALKEVNPKSLENSINNISDIDDAKNNNNSNNIINTNST